MESWEEAIVKMSATYFVNTKVEIEDDFILLILRSLEDEYRAKRNFPSSYSDEMIFEDVRRYFTARSADIALSVIPDAYGRMGAQGLSTLTDNSITRVWRKSSYFSDVLPLCSLV